MPEARGCSTLCGTAAAGVLASSEAHEASSDSPSGRGTPHGRRPLCCFGAWRSNGRTTASRAVQSKNGRPCPPSSMPSRGSAPHLAARKGPPSTACRHRLPRSDVRRSVRARRDGVHRLPSLSLGGWAVQDPCPMEHQESHLMRRRFERCSRIVDAVNSKSGWARQNARPDGHASARSTARFSSMPEMHPACCTSGRCVSMRMHLSAAALCLASPEAQTGCRLQGTDRDWRRHATRRGPPWPLPRRVGAPCRRAWSWTLPPRTSLRQQEICSSSTVRTSHEQGGRAQKSRTQSCVESHLLLVSQLRAQAQEHARRQGPRLRLAGIARSPPTFLHALKPVRG
jgi:hypothetical protein